MREPTFFNVVVFLLVYGLLVVGLIAVVSAVLGIPAPWA